MSPEAWATLLRQLGSLPGGAAAAIPDFFASQADPVDATGADGALDIWRLGDGAALRLDEADGELRLLHAGPAGATEIARTGMALLPVAQTGGVSALLLLLLAIATGQVDDARRLKRLAPRVDAAAKDLMLMTVCRLCG